MAAPTPPTLYRFTILSATDLGHGLTQLIALDPLSPVRVRIIKWTPPESALAASQARLSQIEDDGTSELFSDGQSCYVALGDGADIGAALARLRAHGVFVAPPDPAPAANDPITAPIPMPVLTPPPVPSRDQVAGPRGTPVPAPPAPQPAPAPPPPAPGPVAAPPPGNYKAALIALAIIIAGVLVGTTIYLEQQRKIREAAVALETRNRELREAEARAQAAETARLELERKQKEEAERQLALAAAQPLPFADPGAVILQPAEKITGSFFTTIVADAAIARQKVLVFQNAKAAFDYFQNDPDWHPGRMMISDVTGAGGKVIVLLTQRTGLAQQAFSYQATFPQAWLEARRAEGYAITVVSRVGSEWWLVATKEPVQQIVLGPSADWPAAAIRQQYDRTDVAMRISDMAYDGTQGFVVILSAMPGHAQWWYPDWRGYDADIKKKIEEGYQSVHAMLGPGKWYAVVTKQPSEMAQAYLFTQEYPAGWITTNIDRGYRIARLRAYP